MPGGFMAGGRFTDPLPSPVHLGSTSEKPSRKSFFGYLRGGASIHCLKWVQPPATSSGHTLH